MRKIEAFARFQDVKSGKKWNVVISRYGTETEAKRAADEFERKWKFGRYVSGQPYLIFTGIQAAKN